MFLKVSGFHPAGNMSPGCAVENLPTSSVVEGKDSARLRGEMQRKITQKVSVWI
jgi:hypothetical protein